MSLSCSQRLLLVYSESMRALAPIRAAIVSVFLLPLSAQPQSSEALHAAAQEVGFSGHAIRLPVVDASDIRFRRLSTTQGLSQSRVAQIVQDDRGFMWFGTQYGLNRFDSYNFRIFKHEPGNPGSLSGVYIYSLFKDRAGTLWVGCDQYLDKFDPVTESFTHYRLSVDQANYSGPAVVHISQDRAGILWLATGAGLFKFDPVTARTSLYRHRQNDPSAISSDEVRFTGEDRSGTFWVVTSDGLDALDRTSGKVTSHIQLHDSAGAQFYEDRLGTFWISYRSGAGLAILDRNTKTLIRYSFYDREPIPGAISGVTSMCEDRRGNLWIATQGSGLLRFDRELKRFVRYRYHPGDPDSLPENRLDALYEDREGTVWIGQGGTGLSLFTTHHLPFERMPHQTENLKIMGDNLVSAIHQDRNGVLWIGTPGWLGLVT